MRKSFLFLIIFLSVKLKAAQYVDEPQGCYQNKKFPCAVRAIGSSLSVVNPNYAFRLGVQSNLLFKSHDQIQLLSGSIWVVKSKNVTFNTVHVEVKGQGEYWMENLNSEGTSLKNLNAQMRVIDSLQVEQMLPVGYENWYGGVRQDRTAHQGIIKPIETQKFFKVWNKVSRLPKTIAIQKMTSYQKLWLSNLDESSSLYKEVVQREIASENNREAQQALRLQRQKEEQRVLRQAFRNRISER